MIDLNNIALFVRVARSGSFAEAARRLGLPSNSISRRVQSLEKELGTRLLQRSTRKLALTSAGEAFLERCGSRVDDLIDAGSELVGDSGEANGLVRVAAPADFFDFFSMEWVAEFVSEHPQVKFDFILSDAKSDLIADRIDVAFRGGHLQDSGYVGRQVLSPGNNGLVASADYLKKFGTPRTIEDLANHHCVSNSHASGHATWRLASATREEEVRMPITVSCSTAQTLRNAVAAGLGIALLPRAVVMRDLESGLLVRVLPEYKCSWYGLNVIYPTRKYLPRAVSMFIDLVVEKLSPLEEETLP